MTVASRAILTRVVVVSAALALLSSCSSGPGVSQLSGKALASGVERALVSISCLTTKDCSAVGSSIDTAPFPQSLGAQIAHWNGTRWKALRPSKWHRRRRPPQSPTTNLFRL